MLHQVWISEVEMPDELRTLARKWRDIAHAAGWQYWHWNTSESSNLLRLHFPTLVPTYDSYPLRRPVMKADVVRLAILAVHGGIFVDLDHLPQRMTAIASARQTRTLASFAAIHHRLLHERATSVQRDHG